MTVPSAEPSPIQATNRHHGEPLITLEQVTVVSDRRRLLGPVDWCIAADQQWVVLGPNGGGKSTLLSVASLARHPTSGAVTVLGHRLGQADLRLLRSRVGVCSAGLLDRLRDGLTAQEAVMCGRHGALEPWWHDYGDLERSQAQQYLERVGLGGFAERTLGTMSSGERQRTMLARSLMAEPDVILLDEPTSGLDLAGRESLLASLEALRADSGERSSPSTALVTHHVEDIPTSTTHLLAIADGREIAGGPIHEVLDADLLGELFGLSVELGYDNGRWRARATGAQRSSGSWTQATDGSPEARRCSS